MYELPRIILDVQMLMALTPEELAEKMLFLLKKRNDPKFRTGNLQKRTLGVFHFRSAAIRAAPQKRNKSGSVRSGGMASCRGIDRV